MTRGQNNIYSLIIIFDYVDLLLVIDFSVFLFLQVLELFFVYLSIFVSFLYVHHRLVGSRELKVIYQIN